jgi:hypothetical protein
MLKIPETGCSDRATDAARVEFAVLSPRTRSTACDWVRLSGRSSLKFWFVEACTGTIPEMQTAFPPDEYEIAASENPAVLMLEEVTGTGDAAVMARKLGSKEKIDFMLCRVVVV